MNKERKKTIIWLSVAIIILVIIFFSALMIGRYTISIPSFFSALFNMSSADAVDKSVILSLRLPRTLVALLVGIALSLSAKSGGIPSLTAITVVICGILGGVFWSQD